MSTEERNHLRRLDRVWIKNPLYFLTTCTDNRRKVFDRREAVEILVGEWRSVTTRHGWQVGRYVVMPDHVHFFCAAHRAARPLRLFVAKWKEWTSKRLSRELGIETPIWQPEFFDHLLRSSESYSQKWDYVRNNPVRAGLVENADAWPFQGYIHFM
jgi:REP element-mobilizing transposase RayT